MMTMIRVRVFVSACGRYKTTKEEPATASVFAYISSTAAVLLSQPRAVGACTHACRLCLCELARECSAPAPPPSRAHTDLSHVGAACQGLAMAHSGRCGRCRCVCMRTTYNVLMCAPPRLPLVSVLPLPLGNAEHHPS